MSVPEHLIRKKQPTAEDIRNRLKNKEKQLEWEISLKPALNKDVKDANDRIEKLQAEVAKLRKKKDEHQAKAIETGRLLKWWKKQRDAVETLEEHPEKIRALQKAVRELREDLSTANEAEKERKAAYEARKAAVQAPQPNTTNPLPPVNSLGHIWGTTAGTKRKAIDESQQEPKRARTDTSALTSAPHQPPPSRKNTSATNTQKTPNGQRRTMQTSRTNLRPQQSNGTKSEAAPPASSRPNDPKVNPTTVNAAGKATTGTISSTPNNAAQGQGKKNMTAPTQLRSSRKATDGQSARQKSNGKPNTTKKAGDKAPQSTGNNRRISGKSKSTNGAATGKKTKEMSKSSSGSKSIYEKSGGSRRMTRSTGPVEQSNEDATPPKNKKRSASDDDDDDRGSKRQKTGDHVPKSTRLRNGSQACFSNVIVQLLDAGLGGHDIDALLGEVKDFEPFSSTTGRKLIELIKAAAVAGETEKLSAVKHLRELLAKTHAEYNAQTGKLVDPKVFRLAVAYGAAEDAMRNDMDGTIQQDAFEYYQMLLNILLEDRSLANEEAFRAQFEIETEIRDKCTACKHKSDPRIAINNYHGINVLVEGDSNFDEWDMTDDLFAKSLHSPKEGECDECNKAKLESVTEFTKLPENLVIKLNRTRFANNKATKVETIVRYAETIFPRIKFDNEDGYKIGQYELSAVVMHEGHTIENGHYTIYRQQDGRWFWLDDGRCEEVAWSEVHDLAKFENETPNEEPKCVGHSAMMLYKKAPAGN